MEKTCTNHPESLALAMCKACEKSICLMCVCDEKEGTFCSNKCIQVFREVSDWVEPGATPVPATAHAPAPAQPQGGSIFDPEPAAAPAAAADLPPPTSTEQAEFEPLVTPGTKWRMIGSVCAAHNDTPAVATCEACDKTVCALCVVEAESGTFCTACAASKAPRAVAAAPSTSGRSTGVRPAPAAPVAEESSASGSGTALKAIAAVLVLAVLGGGGWYLLNNNRLTENPGPLKKDPDPLLAKTDPKKTDPAKTDPTKVEPAKVDPKKVEPAKVEPAKVDPKKVEPAKVEPAKVDPAKTVPAKIEPRKKVEPPPKPKPPGVILNPWALQAPGAWYRMKTETGGKESYSDVVLKAKDASSFTLSTGTGDATTSVAPYWVKGEEAVMVEGRRWLCEIREWEAPAPKRCWVLVEGKNAGVVLKEESSQAKLTTKRLWEHTIRFGRRAIDCLVVEGEVNGTPFKMWYSAVLPIGVVKMELSQTTTTLVDFGDDASKRPPIPQ
jgi:hypothetical protein